MPKILRKRTLSQDLTIWLLTMVIVTVALLGGWYFVSSGQALERQFSKQRDFLLQEIAEVLSYPLYNLDKTTITNITRAYDTGNPIIAGIRVQSNFGEIIHNSLPEDGPGLLRGETALHFGSTEIGSLTVVFSNHSLTERRTATIRSAALIIILILFIIALGIHFFMKRSLAQPLHTLTSGIRRIAGGDFSGRLELVPQQDLAAIIEEINTMASRLSLQQEQLLQSEQKYRNIFDNAIEGIFQATLNGSLVTANQALIQILGYDSPEELLLAASNNAWRLLASTTEQQKLLETVLRNKMVGHYTAALLRKDGSNTWCSMNVQVVYGEDSRPLHLEGSVQDISEIRRLEKQLRQAQKMEAIGTLAGGIAHDFNNILTAIFGFTELARTQSKEDPKLEKNLRCIMDAGLRARDLVRQILTFSRQTEKTRLPIPLHLIVKEAVKLLRSSIPSTISIEQDIRTTVCVLADPSQMHQVIMNLGTNGYQAMLEQGGVLRIALFTHHCDERITLQDTELEPGEYLVLEVKDTGPGIPKAILDKIFDPYFTTKGMDKGTGLGLAVVHGIVGDCRGAITVESKVGAGTVFRVFLPVVADLDSPQIQPSPHLPVETSIQGTEHILVVDDEKMIRKLIKTYFTSCGFTVTIAGDGQQALMRLQLDADKYDLLLTDLTMPGLTGIDLACKAHELNPRLPILLCTGFSAILNPNEIEKAGITAVIQKPLSMFNLAQRVRETLDHAI